MAQTATVGTQSRIYLFGIMFVYNFAAISVLAGCGNSEKGKNDESLGIGAFLDFDSEKGEPETVLDSGTRGMTSSTTAQFLFSSPATDVMHFECVLDAPPYYMICKSPLKLIGLMDGSYTISIRAVDQAGNADTSPAIAEWTVDTLPPLTTIIEAPSGSTYVSAAQLQFVGSDSNGIDAFYCVLDNGLTVGCTSPADFDTLSPGEHRLSVFAVDAAGNVGPTTDDEVWTVTSFEWDSLALGYLHTCGLHSGRLYCWGNNNYGQLARDPSDSGLVSRRGTR